MRSLCCGLLIAGLGAGTALAQTPSTSQAPPPGTASPQNTTGSAGEPRPALMTTLGDTGFWFVPTAETLQGGKTAFSLFRANFDRPQGLTDVSNINITGAVGIGGRFEVFGSWGLVRLDRDTRPLFQTDDPSYGGVVQEYPYLRRGWSKTLGGPLYLGGKYSLISQSRGDAFSLAPRIAVKIPLGSQWAGTTDADWKFDLVASREAAKKVEFSGTVGGILRGDPDEFRLSDGVTYGLGVAFPSRSKFRGLAEWTGEWTINQYVEAQVPLVAEDGSVAPQFSKLHDLSEIKLGAVYQTTRGAFVHGGFSWTQGTQGRVIGLNDIDNGWGFDIRIGWHPGVKTYVPPPPPEPVIREVVREVPAAAAPAPPPNRNPTFNAGAGGLGITCDPCILEPGGQSRLTTSATDPDGDALTYNWTAPSGSFNPTNAANTTFTAPNQEGNVPVTVTAQDTRGGSATASLILQVVRKEVITFEDVHFQFDRYNLRPEALMLLDDAVTKLMSNPNVRITIEGHCDSVGTAEYNIALGERRANAVRDYLQNRGVASGRLRTVSYGEDRPAADNNTAQGRATNRRAHLVVIVETVQ
jgi:peptidoglycan-associated lipoprotein